MHLFEGEYAVLLLDRNGTVTSCTPDLERRLGCARADIVARRFAELCAGADGRPRPWDEVLRAASTDAGFAGTIQVPRRDGGHFVARVELTAAYGGEGTAPCAIALLGGAVEGERLFGELLEAAPDALVISDADGRITLVNSQTERLFGYPRGEILGQSIELLMPERFRTAHVRDRHDYAGAPRVRPMSSGRIFFGRRKEGTEFPIEISLSPLKSAGRFLVMSAIRDITERRNQEAHIRQIEELNAELDRRKRELEGRNGQLEKANRDLDEFAYIASHDLQEPLRKLISFSKLLPADLGPELPEKAGLDLHFITDAAARMQALIQDLLRFSRAGGGEMRRAPVALDACVDRALEALESRIAESGAEIDRAALGVVRGDATLLTQLYQNLVGNALKFRRPDAPPRIGLTAERGEAGTVFAVRDNGIGIKPEYLERIFAPFKRLHGREQYEGSGVGLAICRKVVERHGGRIWAESEIDVGSAFRFTLSPTEEGAECKREPAEPRSCSS